MRKRSSPYPLLLGLILIGVASLLIDASGLLKGQLLQTPEALSTVKLVRQKTDPVQFDIYYERLLDPQPPDISLIMVNALVESAGRYSSTHQIIDQVLLQTGQSEVLSTASSETLSIRNLQQQSSTRLGTIVTRLKQSEYISLEYDTVLNRTRTTLIDHPVPVDFPLGYKTVVNPTGELLYVSSPGFHTILSPDEKAFSKASITPHGALLLANEMTTLQKLEGLTQANLIRESISVSPPPLVIEQEQIVLPDLPSKNLNTLILRFRSGANDWDYQYFFLPANKDITTRVPLKDFLDFYTEVEYSFAYISQAANTISAEFPYQSLLDEDEFAAFYRTDFSSLLPELYALENRLKLQLTVSIAPQADAISIGVLTREPLLNLHKVLQKIEQKVPIMIFEDDSSTFTTSVTTPNQLPYFNLIGKNDQVWSQRVNRDNLSLVSESFQQIPLVADDPIPELEVVNQAKGDRLICLLRTATGSFSLGTISTDFMMTSNCLQSARRAGFTEGRIYPLRYLAEENQLQALKHFDFDGSLSDQVPIIKNYDPSKKLVSLTNALTREKVRLLVSITPDFESASSQAVQFTDNSFQLPVLANCQTSCYFKVVSVIREDSQIMLGYASETLMFAETTLPVLQLCFTNLPQIQTLFQPEELQVQILRPSGTPLQMTYRENSRCYEFYAEDAAEESIENEPVIPNSLQAYFTPSEILPQNTIIFHTNGLTTNHINLPPQQHFLPVKTDSLQQVLSTHLVFEHLHLRSSSGGKQEGVLSKSYSINLLGTADTLIAETKGNVLLHKRGETPSFFEVIPVDPPLNETLLYPGGTDPLAIPNTIRFVPGDEIVIQGFREQDRSIVLQLPVPERSRVRMFLENVFRPNIQVKQLLEDGILYRQETGFISLVNPTGIISLPIQVSLNKPTEVSQYARTFPPTPVPGNIDLATFDTQLIFEVVEPANVPNTSLLRPIELGRAQAGFEYNQPLPLGGIEQASSFEIIGGQFLTEECGQIFQFDPEERLITGTPPAESLLQACYFQLEVRYLMKLAYAQIEVSTVRTYRVPLLENPNNELIEPEVIEVPIQVDTDQVSQSVRILDPIEEVIETTSEYVPKSNQSLLITSIGELAIVFSPEQQQFIFSGNPSALQSPVSRYIQAIRQETGELVLLEFKLLPVQQEEIVLPIVEGFPNEIKVPQILMEQGYSDTEISGLTLVTDALSIEPENVEDNILTLFGLPELQNQVFSAVFEKEMTTPSSLVEFDERLEGGDSDQLPNTIRVDFRLTIVTPETIRLNTVELSGNKNITLDLRSYLPASHVLNSTQIPAFLIPNGYVLSGRTPAETQEIDLLIQDFTDVKNYVLPLKILGIESPTIPTEEPTSPVVEENLKGASDGCFPDISNQPAEYRDAICLAQQYQIVSGSNGSFLPNDPINRAEISKILVTGPLVLFQFLSTSDLPILNSAFTSQRFTDVPRSAWFYGFVETVREVDIFTGYPDGSFKPANYLLQAEAAKVIVNTLLQLQPSSFPSNVLQANTIAGDQWFSPYVRILNQNGGDLPDATDVAALSRPISRAQFIYNLLILLDSKADVISTVMQQQ
ncbi:MAG: S-layer homology domain-containing protein [Candidatus Altimarinota bacterium]